MTTTAIDTHGLTEAQAVRLLSQVDWTNWGHTQTVHQRVGKGATVLLRQTAERLGLQSEVKRAGIDVIFVRLWLA